MYLWHGTYDDFKDEIIEDGMLKCNKINETTNEIDDMFIKALGFNPRENCIYFSGDTESAMGYDLAFRIETDDLDTEKLYVGDYRVLDDVLCSENCDEQNKLLKQYNETLVSFDEYMNNANGYLERDIWELEFLYFDDVYVTELDLD